MSHHTAVQGVGQFIEVPYGIPFVMANNLIGGRLNIDSCAHITRKQADGLQKGFSRAGDILLTHKATIGETAIVGDIPFDYLMLTPQVTYYRVNKAEIINRDFLFHFFNGKVFQDQLQLMSGGGTRSYIGITAQRKLPIVLPKTAEEQRVIAEALSDADALIAALEAMIAKKRDLKQAAMQHLLTGKTRLPGFSGEWKVKRLGEVLASRPNYGINAPATAYVERQPPCPRATTTLAGFQAAEVGVSFNVSG
jgi:type I restriction enzyme S subunit